MGQVKRDGDEANADEGGRAGLSRAELRAGAQKLAQLISVGSDAALERLRTRRLGLDEVTLAHLRELQELLCELVRVIDGREAEAWSRLAGARRALEVPTLEPSDAPIDESSTTVDPGGAWGSDTPSEPERLDRPAAGPPPLAEAAPTVRQRAKDTHAGSDGQAAEDPTTRMHGHRVPALAVPAEDAIRMARRVPKRAHDTPVNQTVPVLERPEVALDRGLPFVRPTSSWTTRMTPDASSAQPPPREEKPAGRARDDTIAAIFVPIGSALPFSSRSPNESRDAAGADSAALPPHESASVEREQSPASPGAAQDAIAAEREDNTRLFGFASLAHPLALTVDEYADLCAERDAMPVQTRQTEERYGIHDLPTREAVDRFFHLLFAADPAAHASWEQRYARACHGHEGEHLPRRGQG